MSPPKFSDIGKAAKDLFSDDFGGAANKLTFKSVASNGTNIKVEGARSNSSGAVDALLETKFTHKASGVSVKEKWTTKNVVTTELSVKNKFVAGSDATLSANFLPNGKGLTGLKLKTGYQADKFTANTEVSQKAVVANGVFGYGKFVFGAGTSFDLAKNTATGSKFSVGYTDGNMAVASSIAEGGLVEGSLFHAPSTSLETGVQFAWNGDNNTSFAVAGRYVLDADTFVKAKVDKSLNMNLSYVQNIRPGVSMRLSADVAGNSLASDAHQIGVHLTLNS
eukprot:TRINITY_DN10401_c0_g2_i2.p1 TRINITY_DN10401_c0_g2~~TRINITY_DN10401_c0_g2_i2.p1  ORF type:complete len:298 (+),score=76.75 TRINITY_DN10401_c0_g2_i2:60-896(+)